MRLERVVGKMAFVGLVAAVLFAVPAAYAQPVEVDLEFSPATNPEGVQFQYVYISGSEPVSGGGTCANAADATHNWDAVTFCAHQAGSLTVTLTAVSLTPYTGASCGWTYKQLQGLLYAGTVDSLTPTNGCSGLIQDSYTDNYGGGEFGPSGSFTFNIPAPGLYTFVAMPGCDVVGTGVVTGTATFTFDGNITVGATTCEGPVVPTLSESALIVFAVLLAAAVLVALRRRSAAAA